MKRSILSCALALAIAFPNALFAQSTAPTADKYANHELNVRNAMGLPALLVSLNATTNNSNQGSSARFAGVVGGSIGGIIGVLVSSFIYGHNSLPRLAELELLDYGYLGSESNEHTSLTRYLEVRYTDTPASWPNGPRPMGESYKPAVSGKQNPAIQHFKWLNAAMNELDQIFDFDPQTQIATFKRGIQSSQNSFSAIEIRNILLCLQNSFEAGPNFAPWIRSERSILSITRAIRDQGLARVQNLLVSDDLARSPVIGYNPANKATPKAILEGENIKGFRVTHQFEPDVSYVDHYVRFKPDMELSYQQITSSRMWRKAAIYLGWGALAAVGIGAALYFSIKSLETSDEVSILDTRNITYADVMDMIVPPELVNDNSDQKYDLETFHALLQESPDLAKKTSMMKDNLEQQLRERNHVMKEFNNYVASLKN
jgi:hypothetical protein